jgi:hypothetical protein
MGYLDNAGLQYLWGKLKEKFAPKSHSHDDRYYTEAEVDGKLAGKSNTGHTHTKDQVGLSNVDNTADVNKNVATAGIATTGVRDYNDANRTIRIGYAGAGLTKDNLTHIAGYTEGGNKIKDVSKGVLQSWIGLGDSAYKKTKSRSSKGCTDWTNNAIDDAIVPTMSFMAYWDGAYSTNGASNLAYCDRGRFGTIVTKNSGDYATAGHTHDDRYYTESEMNTKLNGKANSSHTHNYAGSGSAGGTANSVNGLTFAAQTTDPGAGSALTTNKVLIVYV